MHPRGALLVEDTLRVVGQDRIFGMGDVMLHQAFDSGQGQGQGGAQAWESQPFPGAVACWPQASNEIKLGHTAEVNAHLVVDNLKRIEVPHPYQHPYRTPPP